MHTPTMIPGGPSAKPAAGKSLLPISFEQGAAPGPLITNPDMPAGHAEFGAIFNHALEKRKSGSGDPSERAAAADKTDISEPLTLPEDSENGSSASGAPVDSHQRTDAQITDAAMTSGSVSQANLVTIESLARISKATGYRTEMASTLSPPDHLTTEPQQPGSTHDAPLHSSDARNAARQPTFSSAPGSQRQSTAGWSPAGTHARHDGPGRVEETLITSAPGLKDSAVELPSTTSTPAGAMSAVDPAIAIAMPSTGIEAGSHGGNPAGTSVTVRPGGRLIPAQDLETRLDIGRAAANDAQARDVSASPPSSHFKPSSLDDATGLSARRDWPETFGTVLSGNNVLKDPPSGTMGMRGGYNKDDRVTNSTNPFDRLLSGGFPLHATHLHSVEIPGTSRADAIERSVAITQPMGTAAWRDEVTQSVRILVGDRVQVAELQLTPADLGPVGIRITVTDQQASIAFLAAHQETRQSLEDALPQLKSLLLESGIQLGNATVGEQNPPPSRDARGEDGVRGARTVANRTSAADAAVLLPPGGSRARLYLVDTYA